jgi:hypothetical protein
MSPANDNRSPPRIRWDLAAQGEALVHAMVLVDRFHGSESEIRQRCLDVEQMALGWDRDTGNVAVEWCRWVRDESLAREMAAE